VSINEADSIPLLLSSHTNIPILSDTAQPSTDRPNAPAKVITNGSVKTSIKTSQKPDLGAPLLDRISLKRTGVDANQAMIDATISCKLMNNSQSAMPGMFSILPVLKVSKNFRWCSPVSPSGDILVV
jgi:hypothetical protein